MTNREKQIYMIIKEDPLISQEELADKLGLTRSSVAVHISNLMKKGYIIGKGYITQEPTYITVLGAANIDIGGSPNGVLLSHDSNPGTIRTSHGGVGRNIAHNLSLLGNSVKFITALGDDEYGHKIIETMNRLAVDVHESLITRENQTSIYLYINDGAGDMNVAINDMAIYDKITPAFLQSKLETLRHSAAVVLDANLSEDAINYVVDSVNVPFFADPVSCVKAVKFKKLLPKLELITPNALEAEVLSDRKIDKYDDASIKAAADEILARGAKNVIITLGARGAYLANKNMHMILPVVSAKSVNTTGAGDALLSGVVTGFVNGYSAEDSLRLGQAAAAITTESLETNNPLLTFTAVKKRAELE